MRCGFNIVNRIMHLSTERGMKRRNYSQVTFEHLSIDEKSFKKGHHYITVLSHPTSGCVLDVEEDRTKESCKNVFDKSLTTEQFEKVGAISMNMWKPYMQTAQEILPNASIVHDRFHLVKYLNDAIDKVRRRAVKQHQELKNSRYTLLKNPENLTEKQRIHFEAIAAANYEVSKAWQVRENLKDLSSSVFFYLLGFTLSYAMAEHLNGKIQELKTVGRGYRRFTNFRSAILFFIGGLDLYPH